MIELASDRQITPQIDGSVRWSSPNTPSEALLTDAVAIPQPATGICPWRKDAIEQLSRLSSLGANWDGEGGMVPRVDILNSAAGLVDEILRHAPAMAEPFIRPTPDGGVLLAWQKPGSGDDLEVEIETPGMASFVYSMKGETRLVSGIICHDGRPLQDDDLVFLRLLSRFRAL